MLGITKQKYWENDFLTENSILEKPASKAGFRPEASHSYSHTGGLLQLLNPITSFSESSTQWVPKTQTTWIWGLRKGSVIRIKDSCPSSYTGLLLAWVCLFSLPGAHILTEPQLAAAKLRQDCGEGSRALRPDPGGGAECGPRRPWPYLPEPLNDRVVWAVAILVDSMLSPVIHIHIAEATHQQLGKRESVQNCKRGTTWMPKKSHSER